MKAEIISFKTGVTSCYLIRGKEIVMVDSGKPNKPEKFMEMLSENNID